VVQRLEGRFDVVAQLKFSRDGKRLGVGTDTRIVGKLSDATISIWDVEKGNELSVVKGAFGDFAFTPEGKIISGSTEGLLKLWDPETGLKVADLGAIGKLSSLHVEVSPDGRWLVCIGKSGAIEIRRLPDGVVLHSLTNENMGETFALSPDGTLLAWSPRGQRLEVLETRKWTQKFLFKNLGSVAFSTNSQWLVSSDPLMVAEGVQPRFKVWDLTTGNLLDNTISAAGHVTTFSFGRGEVFATGNEDGEIVVWSSPVGERMRSFKPGSSGVGVHAVRDDSRVFATGSSDGNIVLWSPDLGQPRGALSSGLQAVESLAFGSEGKFLAASGGSLWTMLSLNHPPVSVVDARTGQKLYSLAAEGISALAVNNKRETLAVTGRLGVEQRALSSGQLVDTFQGHTKFVMSAAYSPNGRLLVSGGSDGRAIVWDLESKKSKHVFSSTPDNLVLALAFSPDSKVLASGANEKVVVWDVERGSEIFRLEGHSEWVSALAFSASGQVLASGGWDRTIKIWDVATRKPLRTLTGHIDTVRAISFLSESMLLSSSDDGTSKIWDFKTGDLVATLLSFGNKDWLVVTPEGLFDGTADAMPSVAWRDGGVEKVVPLDTFYNDFFYPDLLASIFAGERPKPRIDVSTTLHFPALRILAQQGYAHIQQRDGRTYLCLAQQAAGSPTANFKVIARGVTSTDLTSAFTIDQNDLLCTYRKELPTEKGPYELVGVSDGWKPRSSAGEQIIKSNVKNSTLHVFTVGVNNYQKNSAYAPLRLSVADANAISDFFAKQVDSPEKPFAKVRVWTGLRDEHATKNAIREQLADMAKEVQEDDVVLLFFSGHGRVPPGQSMFYYIPYFPAQAQFSTLDEREVGLNTAMLAEALRKMPARRVVLIVDACQSGGAIESLAKIGEVKVELEKRRAALSKARQTDSGSEVGFYLLAAATPLQEALEPRPDTVPTNRRYGLLTTAILEELRAGTAAGDELWIRELLSRISQRLPQLARERQSIQTPFPFALGADFPITGRRK
jgi:WD40 repeat protein